MINIHRNSHAFHLGFKYNIPDFSTGPTRGPETMMTEHTGGEEFLHISVPGLQNSFVGSEATGCRVPVQLALRLAWKTQAVSVRERLPDGSGLGNTAGDLWVETDL